MIRFFMELDDAKRFADGLLHENDHKVAVYPAGVGFVVLDEVSAKKYATLKVVYNPERRASSRVAFKVPVEIIRVEVVGSA